MSLHFYSPNEDFEKEESINNYKELFLEYKENPPTLKESLSQLFNSGGVPENEVDEYIEELIENAEETIEKRKNQIEEKYPDITYDDSLIISSYTCEAKKQKYSPYKILNRNLVSENRKKGLKNISKYFYLLLTTLRKLPKFYPDSKKKYLYRCIDAKVNIFIDPFRPKLVPYIRGNIKTLWAFTSTSQNITMSYKFLGDKDEFEDKNIKKGTIFSLYGNIWGYDITVFNYYDEEEILLEPEKKILIDNVIPDINDITIINCEIKNTPVLLKELDDPIKINCYIVSSKYKKSIQVYPNDGLYILSEKLEINNSEALIIFNATIYSILSTFTFKEIGITFGQIILIYDI